MMLTNNQITHKAISTQVKPHKNTKSKMILITFLAHTWFRMLGVWPFIKKKRKKEKKKEKKKKSLKKKN